MWKNFDEQNKKDIITHMNEKSFLLINRYYFCAIQMGYFFNGKHIAIECKACARLE